MAACAGRCVANAAADGIGGLPISDAGGLDLDAIKVVTDNLADSATTLTITGNRPADKSVLLKTGWSLVGVVGSGPATSWQSTPGNPPCEAIWEYLPPYQVPSVQCKDGRGFWIKTSEDTTIWSSP